jgi:hypothetical protein
VPIIRPTEWARPWRGSGFFRQNQFRNANFAIPVPHRLKIGLKIDLDDESADE